MNIYLIRISFLYIVKESCYISHQYSANCDDDGIVVEEGPLQMLHPSPGSRPFFRIATRHLEGLRRKAGQLKSSQRLGYFKKLSSSALPTMLQTLGWEKGGADWILLCMYGIALMLAGIMGGLAMSLDHRFLGTVLLLGCVLALPGLFLWKLFVAACEMDEAVHAELEASRIPTWHFDEFVAGKLREFLDQGNELVRSRTVAERQPPENVWVEDLVSWCTRAEDLVTKNLPRSDAVGFMMASASPKVDHSPAELEGILQARLETLRRITLRYMEFAPG